MNKAVILAVTLLTTMLGCTQQSESEGGMTSPLATLFTGAEQYENFNRMAETGSYLQLGALNPALRLPGRRYGRFTLIHSISGATTLVLHVS